ncbi:acyl-CoA dehydrogenase family protein [Parvibaculum sp.]|jgi:pimeloyl-CoA dehydrogenase small subunit|uniref:acyl-CoA dehydrogenase family protein n=1 Tax=Parvibaculum sp. TaxID=2024848 RepID=UPI000C3E0B0C|nr:acyl-CoA dehydrogenase family protein [Parvibaculum sp.]MAU62372.1 pimeloyl-CoA dehydrogenase small subunit [Parvibaculum sp.]MBO6667265.1 acyl-CoA dehydrogenase family protein [Parvibaculum sp.]MBO6691394.1 acyl-CoA dehydrogenase family protein [Parvibaculum sp.]MBO6713817.1 acyl-CoA dehydrogenase family protein [Parvibaculum sp.]|tara:strand:+ start:1222 stop:2352 length:1131 start_codon:yes stop_codon:yes gene_type:complete
MDFSFTEEQTLLRNTVQSLLSDKYDFDTRRKVAKSADGWRPEIWAQFAELGLLAAPFSEEMGGLGGGAIETMIVMEEFGRHLVIEPYVETVVIAGGFLREGGSPAQQEAHIPGIVGGETVWAFAYAEPQGRYNLADLTTTAKKDGSGYVINGYKAVVLGAPWAQKLIVTARTSGGQRDRDGVSVFIVDKSAAGVSTRDYPTVDGRRASEITFENVKVDADALIGQEGKGLPLVEKITDQAIAALSAEAIGCMKELNTATVEYCKTRKQFGVPIGKFQVLQHRMVDMFMAYEQSVSMTYMVNLKLDEGDAERTKAAAGAKVQIGKAGRFVGQQAVQLHGGMGMTDELNVGHYFKRLTMIDTQFGNIDYQLKRYSEAA